MMEPVWRRLEQELRRELRHTLLESLPYPILVTLAAVAGAIVLHRTYPDATAPERILRDLWWITLGFGVLAGPGTTGITTFRHRIAWYRGLARFAFFLSERRGLVTALERAAMDTPDSVGTPLRTVAFECSAGASPGAVLRTQACPEPLVAAVEASQSETELVERLREEFTRYGTTLTHHLRVLQRTAPAVAATFSGTILFWLVVRVVLPVLTSMVTGVTYE